MEILKVMRSKGVDLTWDSMMMYGELLHLIVLQGSPVVSPGQLGVCWEGRIDLLSSVWIFFSWVGEWMYLMYWVACTSAHDFHSRPIVFGEVLARPRVV